mmetsp:Transcript_10398/g.29658  ORF Transcript_10398/g.29658 Transcript_10398/m.29658 type:complete len:236 (-) Transcript_10398:1734-2441(-)
MAAMATISQPVRPTTTQSQLPYLQWQMPNLWRVGAISRRRPPCPSAIPRSKTCASHLRSRPKPTSGGVCSAKTAGSARRFPRPGSSSIGSPAVWQSAMKDRMKKILIMMATTRLLPKESVVRSRPRSPARRRASTRIANPSPNPRSGTGRRPRRISWCRSRATSHHRAPTPWKNTKSLTGSDSQRRCLSPSSPTVPMRIRMPPPFPATTRIWIPGETPSTAAASCLHRSVPSTLP